MFKEIKLAFYIITISLFLFLTSKYYFSDANIKNYFRKINTIDQSIKIIGEKLIVLESDTENIIQDVDKNNDTNKKNKNFSFWELLNNNDG
tara:strand:+ start:1114 stop:1386 length:273 start_codon:yes stop_codon:yes gene_type:complete